MWMQTSSSPACMTLLKLLEEIIQDQKEGKLDKKFMAATRFVINARNKLLSGALSKEIGNNERYFTGAVTNALNSLMQDGFCVLHQACLGIGATHSDISASRVHSGETITLMVGEGKWNAVDLRNETRGQLFNALLRHRAIDKAKTGRYGPILLVAFDMQSIEIDLAFPSTKGGKLEQDMIVSFSDDLDVDRETFWTCRILDMSIAKNNALKNLPIVLKFIAAALEILDEWEAKDSRVQQKIPYPFSSEKDIEVSAYHGPNVTMVHRKASGQQYVCKEYCYHLRQRSDVFLAQNEIMESDKRRPPPSELLKQLGPPYIDWEIHDGPFGIFVLRYHFIEGSTCKPSAKGWVQILKLVKAMHEIDYVHGDLLPQNVLFGGFGEGYLIDFDLSRKVGSGYVSGYNYEPFSSTRHRNARAGEAMEKEHDIHSLREMSKMLFDCESLDLNSYSIDNLIDTFQSNSFSPRVSVEDGDTEASGSPQR